MTPTPVLLNVDDHEGARYARSRILSSAGFRVYDAGTGGETMDLAEKHRPDLVLLDVHLPDMNGIDLAIATKSNHPACRVMLFSGHSNTSLLLEEAAKKGHKFEVLAKPVHPELILETAAHLLASDLFADMANDRPTYD